MEKRIQHVNSTLFEGIRSDELESVLGCIGYHISAFKKGETIALEEEHIQHVGILLSGSVDMIKEDVWGGKTLLLRLGRDEVFGETFACGSDPESIVSFVVSEDAQILFLPFRKVLHTCARVCAFHYRLIENMVRVIADKNRELMRKMEILSKRTLREKILAYLSLQAQIQGARYFEIPLGRLELAEFLCVDRSALTRELTKMRAEGLIDYDRNCFRIL